MMTMTEAEVFPAGHVALAAESVTIDRPVCAHSHDFAELLFVRSGRAEQHTEEGITSLQRGSLVVLAPGSWHALEPESSVEVTNVLVSTSLLGAELAWLRALPMIGPLLQDRSVSGAGASALTLELDPALQAGANASLELLTLSDPQNLFYRLARFFDLLACLEPALSGSRASRVSQVRPLHSQHSTTTSNPAMRYRYSVSHAVSLLHDQIDRNWTLEELAREISLSPSQLARVFRADTGTSPIAYLQRIRAERLGYLLRTTDLTVAVAARAVGWTDPSYAARRFRAYWNSTPNAYRHRL
ncbi:AraC family transcriptional regulator [Aeromicrobium fastidiosum]|uniref:AraC family transcriptional regulator n=1 Tax=Aeromicrobium fastidiosum TaxID=52699 RepID=A0A641AQB7_9ACTN|nr:AraC family transcriptional regulator [Aeromicrobium fastidiosum]KAA1379872.1 AraC family transcriptional regulator [Aeromicrobium fastidiosum]MBP2389375.1 AraC family L-rhamnose operon transcriptional activator RhaR [Aeromicrobium fastidiosum]